MHGVSLYISCRLISFPDVDLRCTKESPARKVPGKRSIDHGRIAFARAVRFALDGVDIALLDIVRLPHQLTVRGLVLLGETLPLVLPVHYRLEVRPEGGQVLYHLGAQGYLWWT
jgi:hypothetical protein